ncbi:MAG: hypothetical protein Q9157_003682 [Trypethelium eluteriae]
MARYGFQGIDIDWEYPGTPDRGGKLEDTQNLVHLVKEMRAAWGKQYGISVTLAPDYWYLRFFDPAAMYDSVDWFGFVAYDLHGSWDADVHALGSIVRGQTDIREIKNDTLPFWFDNIDPAKLNLGLAAYGRGYTLSDPSCHSLGCPFDGPNLAAQCTNQAGIASLVEIKNLVNELKLTETLLSGSMMKQISWGDQWIGYDDHDTWAMKKKWADGLCFGGTMVWSVDLDSGSGSGIIVGKKGVKPSLGGNQLNPDSSCQDLKTYQGLTGNGTAGALTSDMWDMVDASAYLNGWYHRTSSFQFDFANPWGIGQSWGRCKSGDDCTTPDCADFDDLINAPKSAAAYMNIVAQSNLHQVLQELYKATQNEVNSFGTNSAWLSSTFDSPLADQSDLFTKELINGFIGAFAVAAAASGNVGAGAAGAFASAVGAGVLEAFPDPEDTTFEDLGDMEIALNTSFSNAESSLLTMEADFSLHGQSEGHQFADLFQHGAFVDFRTIAILNDALLSTDQLNKIFVKHMQAMVVNWAWHQSRTWIFSYPMTPQDFDNNVANSGSNEPRLKLYHNGRGYFFQTLQSTQQDSFRVPIVQNPPGWGDLANGGNLSFSAHDIIVSSADGFDLGGYGYNPMDNFINNDQFYADVNLTTDSVQLPGIFNLPICPLDESPLGVHSVADAFGILAPVGAYWSPGPEHQDPSVENSPFCYCLGIKDKDGALFEDQIDVKNWATGNRPWCANG